MMWLLPAVVGILGVVPMLIAARRVASEVADMRAEIVRFGELRPALLELRSQATSARAAAVETYRRGLVRG